MERERGKACLREYWPVSKSISGRSPKLGAGNPSTQRDVYRTENVVAQERFALGRDGESNPAKFWKQVVLMLYRTPKTQSPKGQ